MSISMAGMVARELARECPHGCLSVLPHYLRTLVSSPRLTIMGNLVLVQRLSSGLDKFSCGSKRLLVTKPLVTKILGCF